MQGAQRFDVSAHLETNNDLVSFVPDCDTVVKLYTAAMSNSSEEPLQYQTHYVITLQLIIIYKNKIDSTILILIWQIITWPLNPLLNIIVPSIS